LEQLLATCLVTHFRDLPLKTAAIIIIIISLFVQNKMHIKHMNKISEQDNKALRSALTAALSTIIAIIKISIS